MALCFLEDVSQAKKSKFYADPSDALVETDHQSSRLIEAILKIVAVKLQELPRAHDFGLNHAPNNISKPPFDISCVKQLLTHEPDHVYYFRPDDPDARAPERLSFTELMEEWKHADPARKKDHGSFPEVRRRREIYRFARCILRCTCNYCNEGDPVDLQCRPHPFGDNARDMVSRNLDLCAARILTDLRF